ncbi:helix-turn-helix domain-containing protein [Colwellia sp. E2M01]|uniref:AraC family transcriptional regulator n=1 Tax=Colwellia sp. E2M01 TaxID=2841561 RepID=UPI001C090154|nr:helix-turn-helix domain-containing protein [Colwellia sp. E2M01]MBU2869588.1 helix-turn-helix domain-containing protein [Colwellia sp. E2M01]
MSVIDARIFNLNDICFIITIIECLILAFYRFFLDKSQGLQRFIFGAFLLAIVIEILTKLLIWNELVPISTGVRQYLLPYLFVIGHLTRGPLFLLYVYSITQTQYRIKISDSLHFIPMAVGLFIVFLNSATTQDLKMYSEVTLQKSYISTVMWYFVTTVSMGYALFSLFSVRRYYAQLKANYSTFSTVEINWLTIISFCFILCWSWSFIVVVVADLWGGIFADNIGKMYNYIIFFLINSLFIYSLFHSHKMLTCQPFIKKNNDKAIECEKIINKINKIIIEEKIHLEPNINIEEFSKKIAVSAKDVSYILNKKLNTSFFEFINYHRIEEAKSLLKDSTMKNKNILDILLMSGFNNKSSFHRFFNRLVGVSPSEYRKVNSDNDKHVGR